MDGSQVQSAHKGHPLSTIYHSPSILARLVSKTAVALDSWIHSPYCNRAVTGPVAFGYGCFRFMITVTIFGIFLFATVRYLISVHSLSSSSGVAIVPLVLSSPCSVMIYSTSGIPGIYRYHHRYSQSMFIPLLRHFLLILNQ